VKKRLRIQQKPKMSLFDDLGKSHSRCGWLTPFSFICLSVSFLRDHRDSVSPE
jgi:hypothetical protein